MVYDIINSQHDFGHIHSVIYFSTHKSVLYSNVFLVYFLWWVGNISKPGSNAFTDNALIWRPGFITRQDIYFIHNDITTWKHFPHHWLFVRGIRRSPVDFLHKGPAMWSFDDFVISLDKVLTIQASWQWFQMQSPSRDCNDPQMFAYLEDKYMHLKLISSQGTRW